MRHLIFTLCWGLSAALAAAAPARAQEYDARVPADAPQTTVEAQVSPRELDELVAPVALYPDDLLAIVLPAATHPVQIVQAARYLEALEGSPELSPNPEWHESVVALLNYPEVLERLNEDLDWTSELGAAVLDQEAAVIDAVARFRQRARSAGTLRSDRHQVVADRDGAIEIRSTDPQVIYVPDYEPATVLIHEPSFVYRYHARPYPVYYYPYPAGHHLTRSDFWGVTSMYRIGWHDRNLQLHLWQHRAHPYHGYRYALRHYRYYGWDRFHHLERFHYLDHGHYLDRYDRYRPDRPSRSVWNRSRERSDGARPPAQRPSDGTRILRTDASPRDLQPRGERIEMHQRGAARRAATTGRTATPPQARQEPAPAPRIERGSRKHIERFDRSGRPGSRPR